MSTWLLRNDCSRTKRIFRQILNYVHQAKGTQKCKKYLMSSETKLTILEMKLSLIITCLIFFQSLVSSPSRRQIDSSASLTAAGGLAMARTSTRCCFFIELTAGEVGEGGMGEGQNGEGQEGRGGMEKGQAGFKTMQDWWWVGVQVPNSWSVRESLLCFIYFRNTKARSKLNQYGPCKILYLNWGFICTQMREVPLSRTQASCGSMPHTTVTWSLQQKS